MVSVGFAAIEGHIGMVNQVIGICSIGGKERRPGTGADVYFSVIHSDWLMQSADDSLCAHPPFVARHATVENNDKLTAPEAKRDLILAHLFANATPHLHQDLIARRMSKLIVDGFEIVEIDHQQNKRALFAPRTGDGAVELQVKTAAIGQPRERVLQCEPRDFFLFA